MNAETKHGGAVDVMTALRKATRSVPNDDFVAFDDALGAVAELIEAHKALYKHYVNTLESGRDRIISLGGDCDPVDRMEQGDPVLAHSRAILANIRSAS